MTQIYEISKNLQNHLLSFCLACWHLAIATTSNSKQFNQFPKRIKESSSKLLKR